MSPLFSLLVGVSCCCLASQSTLADPILDPTGKPRTSPFPSSPVPSTAPTAVPTPAPVVPPSVKFDYSEPKKIVKNQLITFTCSLQSFKGDNLDYKVTFNRRFNQTASELLGTHEVFAMDIADPNGRQDSLFTPEAITDLIIQGGYKNGLTFNMTILPIMDTDKANYWCELLVKNERYVSNPWENTPILTFSKWNTTDVAPSPVMLRCNISAYKPEARAQYSVSFYRVKDAKPHLIASYIINGFSSQISLGDSLEEHVHHGKYRKFPVFELLLTRDHPEQPYYCELEDGERGGKNNERHRSNVVDSTATQPPTVFLLN